MVDAGVMSDETYLWYDVRPHPRFGTVEVRAMDAQTHVEHTLGPDRADPGDGQGALRALRGGQAARRLPVRDARREQVARRPPRARGRARRPARAPHGPAKELGRRLYDRLREHAQDLGGAAELEGIVDLLEKGTGAARQRVVYEANHDWSELLEEIVAPRRTDFRFAWATYPGLSWQAARTSSSSAAAAGGRCRRTSPNARTAATGCASARRSSSAAGRPSRPSPRASGPRWGA